MVVRKAVVPGLAQHNMVKHRDAEQLAALFEAPSQGAVFLTGSRIAAGMVVCQEDGAGVHEDRRFEHLTGMDDAQGDRSDADGVDANDRMFRVQANDHEMLPIEPIEKRSEKPVRSI